MKWLNLAILLAIITVSGCELVGLGVALGVGAGSSSGEVQANTRAPEELYLGMGEGQHLYRYGEDLLYQGRYRQALAAYMACEQAAYTNSLREAARARRMWLQEVIAAYEDGTLAPPPPVVALTKEGASQVTPKPIYDQGQTWNGAGEAERNGMSVVAVHPNRLDPNLNYDRNGASYHVYGYPQYPGDMPPQQVRVPPRPPYPPQESRWYAPWTW